jgi:hypothetical protein
MDSGDLSIDSSRIHSPGTKYTLMAFDKLNIKTIDTQLPSKLSVDQLLFHKLNLGKQELTEGQSNQAASQSLAHYEKLTLDKLSYSEEQGLSINQIRQTDVTQLTRKTSDGRWNMIRLVDLIKAAGGKKTESDQTVKAEAKKDMRIRVNSIIVDGNSKVIFEDQALDQHFRQELKVEAGSLEKLDTQAPDQPSPIQLSGWIDEHAKVSLSGNVSPFANRLTLDIKANIDGLPLPPMTPYSSRILGYQLVSGEMDAEISLKADAGELDGIKKLKLYQLEVKPVSPEEMAKLDSKLDVPLETGLAMLRDKNNKIELSLPIKGDVENFQIDPSDAINQVVGKAMKQAAKTYLSTALFPYGTLLTVVQIAGEEAMKVRLDPITYTPGSTRLGSNDKEYLGKVAQILNERPEIHVKLCGIATATDRDYLTSQQNKIKQSQSEADPPEVDLEKELMQLAQNRAELIETYLVEEHGTKANRLISCQPRVENKDSESKPRTELSI